MVVLNFAELAQENSEESVRCFVEQGADRSAKRVRNFVEQIAARYSGERAEQLWIVAQTNSWAVGFEQQDSVVGRVD